MLGKLFGKKKKQVANAAEGRETGPAEDASAILSSVDYYLLRAAWDEYATIKKDDPDYQYGDATPTPCWRALERLSGYGGDFRKFSLEERNLLQALRTGFMAYDDVMHVLIDHHSDGSALADLATKYPDLPKHLPAGFGMEKAIDVMIEVVRDYQWQLEHFGMKFGTEIDAALDPAHAGDIAHHAVALPDAHQGSYDGKESYLSDAELGLRPKPSPMAEKLAASVLDKIEAMEASLAVEAPAQSKTASVLDQEELKIVLQSSGRDAPKTKSVLDQEELKKLQN